MKTAQWVAAPAQVLSRHALYDPAGASAELDRTAHVRAASGLAWMKTSAGPRLVVAEDDTSHLAILDPRGAVERSVALAHVVDGRRIFETRLGNKKAKLDLEACASLPDGGVLVVGSGSLPIRERMVLVTEHQAVLVHVPLFYEALRARSDFAGSELNVEGAAVMGAHLVLANRGNGAPNAHGAPLDSIAMFSCEAVLAHLAGGPVPPFVAVAPCDLGLLEGVRLTFTDLTVRAGTLYFLASAEASPNVIDDGAVVGAALGRMRSGKLSLARLLDEKGLPLKDKVEGLAWGDPEGQGDVALAVVDADDPDAASACLRIRVPEALL